MLKFCSIFLLLSCLFACAIVKPSKHLTLYVSENTVTCYAGELLKQCLLVKYTTEQAEWEYFYDDIDGFDYQRGTAYQIQVKVDEVSKPPSCLEHRRILWDRPLFAGRSVSILHFFSEKNFFLVGQPFFLKNFFFSLVFYFLSSFSFSSFLFFLFFLYFS